MFLFVLRQSWRNPIFFRGGGGGANKVDDFPPPHKHVKIFALRAPKFFWWNKSNFVVQKKKRFWWKIKNYKIFKFWKFWNRKNWLKRLFLEKTCLVSKTPVNFAVVWFFIFIFLPLKWFFISKETKRSQYNSFEQTKCIFHGFRQVFKTKWFYRSPFNRWISPGLS